MSRTRLLKTLTVLALVFGMQMPAHALTVSPPTYDYSLNAGDVIRDTIKIYNGSKEAVTVYPEVFNFTFTDGDETSGTPSFYPAGEDRNGHELGPWLKVTSGAVTLQPQEHSSVEFSLTVPKDVQPGSHFGSIQLRNAPSGSVSGPTVGVVGGIGVLILVRIGGNATDALNIVRFSGDQATYTHLPVDLRIRLEDVGNTHVRPTGNVFITDMFGRQVASIPVNSDAIPPRSILPGSARRFDVSWLKHQMPEGASELSQEWRNFAFGKYTATLDLNYGDPNAMKQAAATYTFWVIPWMVLTIGLLGTIILILLLVAWLKWYNRMVIRRYEQHKRN